MKAQEAAGSRGGSSTTTAPIGSLVHASPHGLSHSATVTQGPACCQLGSTITCSALDLCLVDWAWLRELSATWTTAEATAERADVLHAIYDTCRAPPGTLVGSASASPWAYADGVSLTDTIFLPATVIRSGARVGSCGSWRRGCLTPARAMPGPLSRASRPARGRIRGDGAPTRCCRSHFGGGCRRLPPSLIPVATERPTRTRSRRR
jgi:hypothetical protein